MTARAAAFGVAFVRGVVLVVQAAAVTHPIVPAERAQAPSRFLDRTMTCSIPPHAGLREVQPSANSGTRDANNRSLWTHLASVQIHAGGFFSDAGLAGAAAAGPEAKERFPVRARASGSTLGAG
jgi:hypothetical protein